MLYRYRPMVQAFMLDMDPVFYDRLVFLSNPSRVNGGEQYLCFQRAATEEEVVFGYAGDPYKAGWGPRNRTNLFVGIVICSLYPAISHAVLGDPVSYGAVGQDWMIKGIDIYDRDFTITNNQLIMNLDEEGSIRVVIDRSRDAVWREISGLGMDVLLQGTGSTRQGVGISSGYNVSVTKMQDELVRLEIPNAEGQPIIFQVDEVTMETINFLPRRFWGSTEIGSALLYLSDDEDEELDDV